MKSVLMTEAELDQYILDHDPGKRGPKKGMVVTNFKDKYSDWHITVIKNKWYAKHKKTGKEILEPHKSRLETKIKNYEREAAK